MGIKEITEFIKEISPQVLGIAISFFIAFVRVIYTKGKAGFKDAFLEAVICGGLSLSVGSAIIAVGLDNNWILFASGFIGHLGSDLIKAISVSVIKDRLK